MSLEIFANYILPILQLLIVVGIPFLCVVISGSIARGIFWTWFLFVLWYIMLLCLNPLFIPIGVELIDGPELFVAVIIGWFPGIIISVVAMLFREPLLKVGRTLRNKKNKDTISSLEEQNIYYNEK